MINLSSGSCARNRCCRCRRLIFNLHVTSDCNYMLSNESRNFKLVFLRFQVICNNWHCSFLPDVTGSDLPFQKNSINLNHPRGFVSATSKSVVLRVSCLCYELRVPSCSTSTDGLMNLSPFECVFLNDALSTPSILQIKLQRVDRNMATSSPSFNIFIEGMRFCE